MSLLWGVESFQMKFEPKAEDNITLALIRLRDEGYCVPGQMFVIVTNVILGPSVIDSIQLRAVPANCLDADAFQAFKDSGDLFNPGLAARFRELLTQSGSDEGMKIYTRFRGKEPDIKPLLIRRGLE